MTQQDLILEANAIRSTSNTFSGAEVNYPPHRNKGTPRKRRKMVGNRALSSYFRNPFSNHRP
jgi:hypothetical protein